MSLQSLKIENDKFDWSVSGKTRKPLLSIFMIGLIHVPFMDPVYSAVIRCGSENQMYLHFSSKKKKKSA